LVFDNGTNVGINQAIPTRTLDILGASGIGTVLKLQGASGTTTYLQLAYNGATNAQSGYIGYNSSSQLQFFTNDTLALTIDSSRNLGLGVTPSAWGSSVRALQFENGASIASNQSSQVSFNNNVFAVPGTNDFYIANGFASRYIQFQGQHSWSTAASGTAGNAITFTQPMTLTSGGNLLVGTTTDAGFRLDVNGTGRFKIDGSSKFGLDILNNAGSRGAGFYNTGGNNVQLYFYNSAGVEKIFLDGGSGAAGFSSSVSVGGSFSAPHTTKSANYTLTAADYTVGFDCASNRTANLPDATTCAGRIYVIYQYNTNNGVRYVTLDGSGSQTIDGVTTYSLAFFEDFSSVMIQSNGSNWIVIAVKLYPPVT
jgi:hypothetical protein